MQNEAPTKLMNFALRFGWEVRPRDVGLTVFGRGTTRVFVTFKGGELSDAVLVRLDHEDRPLPTMRHVALVLKKLGEDSRLRGRYSERRT